MMYRWEPDMIRYMREASENSPYNRQLVDEMLPWLEKDMHICDAGCGLGYLSMELASHVGHVTAVDINADALQNLKEKALSNVTVRCGDIEALQPSRPYDAMAFCFFGGIEEILRIAREQCSGSVFVISRNYTSHRFSVGNYPTGSYGFPRAKSVLTEKGIPFTENTLQLEFGQPFRSLEDARRFFELYSRDRNKELITDEFLKEKLVEQPGEFPWYLPHLRNIGFLCFDAQDIPGEK